MVWHMTFAVIDKDKISFVDATHDMGTDVVKDNTHMWTKLAQSLCRQTKMFEYIPRFPLKASNG